MRGRRHLTPVEIKQICQGTRRHSRYPDRDELMIIMAYHHGLRVSEMVNLKWQHVDLKASQITVNRLKQGINTTHPITDKREMMLLRRLHKAQGKPTGGYLYLNERGCSVSANGFQKMFSKASELATGIKWNSHSLRHACGTALISKGHDLRTVQVYLGHRNIQNTTQYLHESSKQFESIEW
ncbi:MAG: tyrosine-type recombinase/integrase [Pseudomonadota bacterium]